MLDVFFFLAGGEVLLLSSCAALWSGFDPEAVLWLGDVACALGRFFADFKCAGAEFCFGSRILALAPRRLLPPVPTKPPFCAALLTSERAQNINLNVRLCAHCPVRTWASDSNINCLRKDETAGVRVTWTRLIRSPCLGQKDKIHIPHLRCDIFYPPICPPPELPRSERICLTSFTHVH